MMLLLYLISSANQTSESPHVIIRSISPDEKHSITVMGYNPVGTFGSQRIFICFDNSTNALTTLVGNDGGEAIIKEIVWQKDSAYICIGGKGQKDLICLVRFEDDQIVIALQNVNKAIMKMKLKTRTIVIILLAVLFICLACFSWALFAPFETSQELLDKNYEMYSTLADFFMNLSYTDVHISCTDDPFNSVFVSNDPTTTPPWHWHHFEDASITELFCSCFDSRKCQGITKKGRCIIFQIWSTLDNGWGIMYIETPPKSNTLLIDGESYEISALDQPGWFSYYV